MSSSIKRQNHVYDTKNQSNVSNDLKDLVARLICEPTRSKKRHTRKAGTIRPTGDQGSEVPRTQDRRPRKAWVSYEIRNIEVPLVFRKMLILDCNEEITLTEPKVLKQLSNN